MQLLKKVFGKIKNNYILSKFILFPFYFFRFSYYALREDSIWFYRYYPGYHGSTIPSLKYIKANRKKIFDEQILINDGIIIDEKNHLALLEGFKNYLNDFLSETSKTHEKLYCFENDMFGFADGFILYCIFRRFRPNQVIEVGSGFSSALMLDISSDILPETNFTFIDPYSTTIRNILESKPQGNYKLLPEEIQNVDLRLFLTLKANDILFIDTSHVLKISSDLTTHLFSILPSLQKGVIIHIHDIWYPWEYPEEFINEGRAYNEIYFIRAFLQFNNAFEILFFNSYVEKNFSEYLEQNMPKLVANMGGSLWLRKIS